MKKLTRILLLTLAGLILLSALAIALTLWLVDPNKFKPQINQALSQAISRPVTIAGNLSWSFHHGLGISIQDISVDNPAGSQAAKPFLHIKQTAVQVDIWPLLKGQVSLKHITLIGFELNLMATTPHQNNWADIFTPFQQKQTAATHQKRVALPASLQKKLAAKQSAIQSFPITNISLRQGIVHYQSAKHQLTLKDIDVDAGNLGWNTLFSLTGTFTLDSQQPHFSSNIKVRNRGRFDPSQQTLALQDIVWGANTITPKTAPETFLAGIRGETNINFATQDLQLKLPIIKLSNLQLSATLSGKSILSQTPQLTGQVSILETNLIALMKSFNITPPHFSDSDALTEFSGQATIATDKAKILLQPLKLILDEQSFDGNLTFDEKTQAIQFALSSPMLDLKQYRLATTENKATTTPHSGQAPVVTITTSESSLPDSRIPLTQLPQQNITGTLSIEQVKLNDTTIKNLQLAIEQSSNRLLINPITAEVADGQYRGAVELTLQQNVPYIRTKQTLTNINVPVAMQLLSSELKPLYGQLADALLLPLSGRGNLTVDLSTFGNRTYTMRHNLQGSLDVALQSGVLHGFDFAYYAGLAQAIANKTNRPDPGANPQTHYSRLSAHFDINQGIATSSNIALQAPVYVISGQGSANLLTQALQFELLAQAVRASDQKPVGPRIPLRVTGNFKQPKIHLNEQGIVNAIIDKQKQRLKEKAKQELQRVKDNNLFKQLDYINN